MRMRKGKKGTIHLVDWPPPEWQTPKTYCGRDASKDWWATNIKVGTCGTCTRVAAARYANQSNALFRQTAGGRRQT